MIPKLIHYCWFGPKEMSPLERECIQSWEGVLSDYSMHRWTESNFDFNEYRFAREAAEHERFAFVSDVARFHALFQHGGIYLDTDFLILKPLHSFLGDNFFLGEHLPGRVGVGLVGAVKGHPLCARVLEYYRESAYNPMNPKTVPDLMDEILSENVEKWGVKIYPPEVFYPLPFKDKGADFLPLLSDNSVAVHLWNHSWIDEFGLLRAYRFRSSFTLFLKRIFRNPSLNLRLRYIKRYIKAFKRFFIDYLKGLVNVANI